jgi:hypothetical protein
VPGTYSDDVRGTSIVFSDFDEVLVEERPFLRESRQSRNLDWATRRDWKDWVRVWRSEFRDVFSWFNCGRDRSVIFTVAIC